MNSKRNPFIAFIKEFQQEGLESFNRFYSTYRAFVANNDDPKKLSRVQLIIPEITGSDVLPIWAYPKGVFSGKGYGTQNIPVNGDVVWVEFEHGNPMAPIWSHGYHGMGEKPEGDYQDINCHWFRTPKGHSVRFNDTQNSITIEHADGDTVVINQKSISINSQKKKIVHGNLDDAKYSHVLGEELQKSMNQLAGAVQAIATGLNKDITAASLSGTTFLPYANQKAAMTQALKDIGDAIKGLTKILSTQVKLEK